MLTGRVAALACLALIALGAQARAEVSQGQEAYRTMVFWYQADRLWTGGLEPEGCNAAGAHAPLAAARVRTAVYQQRGELIGEIRAQPAEARAVVAQAHSCALEADAAVTTYALLTDAERNWGLFHTAFSTCMRRNNQAEHLGSMTLWIDQSCDW